MQKVEEVREREVPDGFDLTGDRVHWGPIERYAVNRRPSHRAIGEGETILVPLSKEEVTLDKRAVVYEEVAVGKHAVQETQQVSGTVRREEAVIEKEGAVQIVSDTEASGPRRS